jgi:hypothetical protein
MKRRLWLALAGLGALLLALGRPEAGRSVDSHLCLAGWARSVGPWGEPTAAPPTADSGGPQSRAPSGSPRTV